MLAHSLESFEAVAYFPIPMQGREDAMNGMWPDWFEDGLARLWRPYCQMKTAPLPLAVVATEGSRIRLADGRELIDGISSWWTAVHGYNHPHIRAAMASQLATMPHVMFGGLMHEPAARLAARLSALSPTGPGRVFFAESGSVSVEVAIKMALQYWLNRGERRSKLVHFRHGYHGDTLGTMAVCDPEEGMHSLFRGMLATHVLADIPVDGESERRFCDLLDRHHADVAAVIIEPLVQGAGGMRFHPPGALKALADAAQARGLLLIADEIFTGFGRTGTMFACEQAGVRPDIMTVSKALTGGTTPLSAAIAGEHVYAAFHDEDPMKALMHGPTYMAHPLGCAAANASLDLFAREPRLAEAQALGEKMDSALRPLARHRAVADIRVMGAIGVVELRSERDAHGLGAAFLADGVFLRPLGRVVYLTPALNIPDAGLERLCQAILRRVGDL
ncbi:MAG: adenosylmethionine--8-amino-7-oxononanoate transaminase [Rhodothalassiaceae bacterium]